MRLHAAGVTKGIKTGAFEGGKGMRTGVNNRRTDKVICRRLFHSKKKEDNKEESYPIYINFSNSPDSPDRNMIFSLPERRRKN